MVEINHQQPSTTINNHQQPSSTIINHHEPMFGGFFGTIKIDPYPSEADPRHRQAIGKSRLWDLLLQRTSNLRCHVFLVLLQVSLANQMVSHATTEITQNHGNVFFAKDDFQKNSYTGWPINPINETRFIQILITYQSWSISLLTPCLQRELHWCEARSLAAGMGQNWIPNSGIVIPWAFSFDPWTIYTHYRYMLVSWNILKWVPQIIQVIRP